jgi:hypothetical protein
MPEIDPDRVSRIALIALQNGSAATLEEAERQIADRSITILAVGHGHVDRAWQAAVIAAAELAARSFGRVNIMTKASEELLVGGPYRGQKLGHALDEIGIHRVSALADSDVIVVIGDDSIEPRAIYAAWDGWTASAALRPVAAGGERDTSNVIAAIAAAALAISEAFHYLLNELGSDAGYRTVSMNLWGEDVQPAAPLRFAPSAWWLVGLGHLGQAYAFTIAHLSYRESGAVEVVVQDTDVTSFANHSTSILTPRGATVMKTRIVASALDRAGLRTRIIERRMSDQTGPDPAEAGHLALIGVDNLAARRLISSMGWARTIDAGLGHRAANYGAITIHSFPSAKRSDEIEAWREHHQVEERIPLVPGFQDLESRFDHCGIIELAGKAVGVPFVGLIAATLAISISIRELQGSGALPARRFDLKSLDHFEARPSGYRALDVNAAELRSDDQ